MDASPARARGRIVLLLLGALLLSVRPSWAGCSPPEIGIDRRAVAAGERVVVFGVGWSDGCSEPREGGCGRDQPPRPSAVAGIELSLVPGAASRSSVPLGSVDAGEDYAFEVTVTVPRSTPPGRYSIEGRAPGHLSEPPVPIVVTD